MTHGKKILGLMATASGNLKFPKIRISAAGQPLVLSLAGDKSRYPGSISITDGGYFGDNTFYGRIMPNGDVRLTRAITDAARKVLGALAARPEYVCALYGQRIGHCCYCGKELSDERSLAAGYGQTCAKNWGLPWGNKISATNHQLSEAA